MASMPERPLARPLASVESAVADAQSAGYAGQATDFPGSVPDPPNRADPTQSLWMDRLRRGRDGRVPLTRPKDPELVALGARVRELRERVGKSQETLAHDADRLHWTYVGQIERGLRNVTYKNLRRLAQGLDVDIAELFRPVGSPVRDSQSRD